MSWLVPALASGASPTAKPVLEIDSTARMELHEGIWFGSVAVTGIAADDSAISTNGNPMLGTNTFLVTVCDRKGFFWIEQKDGNFYMGAEPEKFSSHSNHGNHLIYFENFDRDTRPSPDWAETQIMQLVELESGVLRIQWSRAVGNPHTLTDNRDFFWHGVGTLKQVADKCSQETLQKFIHQ